MQKIKCFEAVESASHPGKYMIQPIHDNFHLDHTTGSFNLICARLFGIGYHDYLRMCRDIFGAEVVGKNEKYPVAYFKRSEGLKALVDQLNARANFILWEREHPDYAVHAEFVKEKNPHFYQVVTGSG